MAQSKRPAKFEIVFVDPDTNETTRLEFGAVFRGRYEGNFNVALSLPTGEEDANGYPVRDRIVAVKTESGKKVSIAEAFVNLHVYEALEAKPRRGDGGKPAPKAADFSDDDDDF